MVFPPLGQFIEGGLLLATRDHQISMATLPEAYYADLDRLMAETCDLLAERYGCRPLLFEHAPAAPGDKGTCCVDHAHLNVFPARVDVHAQLSKFPHAEIGPMSNLSAPWFRNRPYLFLQTNEGRRFVYDAGIVPSQYVRRIITARAWACPSWHWREYLGLRNSNAPLSRCPLGGVAMQPLRRTNLFRCSPCLSLERSHGPMSENIPMHRETPITIGLKTPARGLRHGAEPDGGLRRASACR